MRGGTITLKGGGTITLKGGGTITLKGGGTIGQTRKGKKIYKKSHF